MLWKQSEAASQTAIARGMFIGEEPAPGGTWPTSGNAFVAARWTRQTVAGFAKNSDLCYGAEALRSLSPYDRSTRPVLSPICSAGVPTTSSMLRNKFAIGVSSAGCK